jgi:branched-chain amino acid transport system ATP-binding protein
VNSPLLSLENVVTYYGQMRILEGVSLQVREGELVCLLGGNASGKSTTLKTILGIVRPRSGRVVLAGQDVTRWSVPDRIARDRNRAGKPAVVRGHDGPREP